MRNLPPFLRMVWETHRGYTAAIVALRLVRAFVPLASLWIGKLIIDAVVRSAQSDGAAVAVPPKGGASGEAAGTATVPAPPA